MRAESTSENIFTQFNATSSNSKLRETPASLASASTQQYSASIYSDELLFSQPAKKLSTSQASDIATQLRFTKTA